MMALRKTTLSMTLLAAVASMTVAISACSGGGGDDDDDDNTPIPNPYEACLAFWDHYSGTNPTDPGSRAGIIGDLAWWTSGAATLNGTNALGFMLYDGIFGTTGGFTATYESTSGSVTLTAPSNSLGEPVDIAVGTPWTWYLAEGTGGNVTGGTGDMQGAFFDDFDDCFGNGDPEDCLTAASGDLTFTVGSTGLTVGVGATPVGVGLVFCRDLTAFEGTFRERAMQWVKTLPRNPQP